MKKSAVSHNPTYFDNYLNQVEDIELSEAFQQSISAIDALNLNKLQTIGDQLYAPGKWTIRDLFQHLIDVERVFAYRALRFARNDKTELPGFDENLFADNTRANHRSLGEILAELRLVRQSSVMLFDSFDEPALRRSGLIFDAELPVLTIGFILAGHQNHHFRVMEARYFPLIK